MGRKPLSTLALKLSSLSPLKSESSDRACVPQSPFERFLFSTSLSDVTFVLDNGAEVPGHRVILVAGSHALRALLEDNVQFSEGKRKNNWMDFFDVVLGRIAQQRRIHLHDVEEEVLKFVFRFLYSGQAVILINQEAIALQVCFLVGWLVV